MDYGQVFLRTILMFAVAMIVVRIMGKRAIGQLAPFDFVLIVGVGDIMANTAMDKGESVSVGIEALLTIAALGLGISYLSLKSRKARLIIEGKPSTIVRNGKLQKDEMAKSHFNMDDLRQEIHKQGLGLTDIPNIKEARLEDCGTFTIIKQPDAENATVSDVQNILKEIKQMTMTQQKLDNLLDAVEELLAIIKERDACPNGRQDPKELMH